MLPQIWVATTGDEHNLFAYSNRLQPGGLWHPPNMDYFNAPKASATPAMSDLSFEPQNVELPSVLWLGTEKLAER